MNELEQICISLYELNLNYQNLRVEIIITQGIQGLVKDTYVT